MLKGSCVQFVARFIFLQKETWCFFFLWLWNTNIQPEGLCAIRISIWWDFFAHRPENTQIIFTFTTPQTIETEQRQGDKRKTKGELINTNEPFCVCVDVHPRFFWRVYTFCVCAFFAYILVRLSPSCTVSLERYEIIKKWEHHVLEYKLFWQWAKGQMKSRVLGRNRTYDLYNTGRMLYPMSY